MPDDHRSTRRLSAAPPLDMWTRLIFYSLSFLHPTSVAPNPSNVLPQRLISRSRAAASLNGPLRLTYDIDWGVRSRPPRRELPLRQKSRKIDAIQAEWPALPKGIFVGP